MIIGQGDKYTLKYVFFSFHQLFGSKQAILILTKGV